jgi:hypothetical protein
LDTLSDRALAIDRTEFAIQRPPCPAGLSRCCSAMIEATTDREQACRAPGEEQDGPGSLRLGFRPFCARMPIQNCRHMRLVATERISSTAALATKCASIAKNMAATRQIAPDRNAKHAAGQTTETLGASNAVSVHMSTYSCTKCKPEAVMDPEPWAQQEELPRGDGPNLRKCYVRHAAAHVH